MPDLPKADWAHLIPHAGNMCLLDVVRDFDDTSIHAASLGHRDHDHPLRSEHGLHAVHLAEYGAQAVAVHGALMARQAGHEEVRPGRLVSLRDVLLTLDRIDTLSEAIDVHAERLYADDAGAQYIFRIEHAGNLLASGRVAVIHPRA
ncbi:phosphotransferase [Dyella sp.]|uniref:phosphotransferase n=1 Tax=Dyella sp. TaxID=1869338 RepID=UPI002ED01E2D